MLQIGSVVDGKYKVLNKIGQGGMSVVYLALNERANKTWAIKEVRKDGVQDFATVKRGLIAETNILKSLSHKYLPSIVDVIDDKDTFIIVMDYIQGKSLKELLKESMEYEGFPMAVEDVISWGKQLCEVLYYLHTREQPIIYRDMKPSNVMIKPDGEISLIDFGTARVFKTGNTEDTICLGTPGYAAPEQYGGNGQTRPQTDIYCLGATLHHLITGRDPAPTPFNFPLITQCRPTLLDETPRELRNAVLGLEMVIEKCTQYEIKDRYQSCAELKYDLEHLEELGLPYRKKLKHKMIAFGGCLLMAAVLGGVSLFGMIMENRTKTSGYDYYIEAAKTASSSNKLELYQKAIELNPTSETAYLEMLEEMIATEGFTTEDDALMTSVLYSKYNGRDKDNKTYFQANRSGYVYFAYELGCAYYTAGDGSGDKSSAAGWFQIVNEADLDSMNFDINGAYVDKTQMKAMSEILGRICDYYKSNSIGKVNELGMGEYTYGEYWDDLMALLDGDVAGDANVMLELKLYNEIVYQIYTRTIEFKTEAGLKAEDLNEALDKVTDKLDRVDSRSNSIPQTIMEIEEDIAMARKNITAAYASNAVTGNSTGGGNGS